MQQETEADSEAMKLDSKYFDSIRSKSSADRKVETKLPPCQWKGCAAEARYRAPRGRGHEGRYFTFCLDHVRAYNATYNYFDGMSDSQVEDYQKDAITGHRPTWKSGANAWAHGVNPSGQSTAAEGGPRTAGPQGFFAWRQGQGRTKDAGPKRLPKPLERKALDQLNLGDGASREEIKARFKSLVKQHHPDANGGDKGSEDKLREIIQAYNYLKQAGLV